MLRHTILMLATALAALAIFNLFETGCLSTCTSSVARTALAENDLPNFHASSASLTKL
jgi:hypothetical protein